MFLMEPFYPLEYSALVTSILSKNVTKNKIKTFSIGIENKRCQMKVQTPKKSLNI